MKLTNKQVMILFQTFKESLWFSDGGSCPFGFSNAIRTKIYNEILNQQSDELGDLEKVKDQNNNV